MKSEAFIVTYCGTNSVAVSCLLSVLHLVVKVSTKEILSTQFTTVFMLVDKLIVITITVFF